MNHDDRPMWDDPAESSALRQLLRAGRSAVSDYDVERGLARHIATVQASALNPAWVSLSAARGAATPILTWLVVPLVAASAFVGVWLVAREAPPPEPRVQPDMHASAPAPSSGKQAATAEPSPQPSAAAQPSATDEPSRSASAARTAAPARPMVHPMAARRGHAFESPRNVLRATDPVSRGDSAAFASREANGTGANGTGANGTGANGTGANGTGTGANGSPTAFETTSNGPPAERAATADATANNPAREDKTDSAQANAAQPPKEPSAARSSDKPAAVASPDDARLEREMQMLAVAQRVLSTDPSRALRLAHQGEHEFPGSMFSAERKQVGLLALVQLGRLDEARRLGKPFLLAYPNAPWSERLRRALATGRIPAP